MGNGAGLFKGSESKYAADGSGLDDEPLTGSASASSAGKRVSPKHGRAVAAEADNAPRKKARGPRAEIARAAHWSRSEAEQLSVSQLCRWLESLGVDVFTVIQLDRVSMRLWKEIEAQRPSALADVQGPEQLLGWPLDAMLKWLEYFGAAEGDTINKGALVQLLLEHGEDLPPPAFLAQTREEETMTQVEQLLTHIKGFTGTLHEHLARDTAEVEAVERQKNPWHPNGRCVAAFRAADLDAGAAAGQTQFLDVEAGTRCDITVHEASGWAWCMLHPASPSTAGLAGAGQGWIPASSVVEVFGGIRGGGRYRCLKTHPFVRALALQSSSRNFILPLIWCSESCSSHRYSSPEEFFFMNTGSTGGFGDSCFFLAQFRAIGLR